MKIIPIEKLYDYNYSIEVINAMKQDWKVCDSFNCFGNPKKQNIFLYLSGCSAEYKMNNGKTCIAKSGDIVYAPINLEYSVQFYDFKSEHSHTIGVNCFLFDADNLPFVLSNEIKIFTAEHLDCSSYFYQINEYSNSAKQSFAMMKACMYNILSILSEGVNTKKLRKQKFGIISNGINYLEHNGDLNLSVGEIAKLCNVSEVYFRRLFKSYSGLSPVKFILVNKIEKAKIFLEYENMSISEISDYLDFVSPAYFTSQFKAITGQTPSEYRKSLNDK